MGRAVKVRVSRRVLDYLSGTQAWADEQAERSPHFRELSERSLMARLIHARRRKDGSVVVELAWTERDALWDYASAMSSASSQSVADYNAARALLRNLRKEYTS